MVSSSPSPERATTGLRGLGRRCVGLLRLPPRELLTMMHVTAVIAFVEVLIRWVPLPRLASVLGVRLDLTVPRERREPMPIGELSPNARRQLRCTNRVADVWPFSRGPCLRRSLVAGHLLRRHRTALRLGVAGVGDDVHAHAWLEIDGRPLEAVGAFTAFHHTPGSTT